MRESLYDKHVRKVQEVKMLHDGKRGVLQTWEAWRVGSFKDDDGSVFVYKPNPDVDEDIGYEKELILRVDRVRKRLEAMKPIGEL